MAERTCTGNCMFTGRPCTRYGYTFTSLLRMDHWFATDRRRKTLWRAVDGEWREVATSTSIRVLGDRFTSGSHVVMPAGSAPEFPAPVEVARSGGLF